MLTIVQRAPREPRRGGGRYNDRPREPREPRDPREMREPMPARKVRVLATTRLEIQY